MEGRLRMGISSIFNVRAREKQPVFVVAEVSANHAQHFDRAVGMIETTSVRHTQCSSLSL